MSLDRLVPRGHLFRGMNSQAAIAQLLACSNDLARAVNHAKRFDRGPLIELPYQVNAEGQATASTQVTSWIGDRADYSKGNADFQIVAEGTIGWQTSWTGGLKCLYDWAESTGGGGEWYEVLTEALLMILFPDQYQDKEEPDWGESWVVPNKASSQASIMLTPEEYSSLLSDLPLKN
jgi:hypothetical protein